MGDRNKTSLSQVFGGELALGEVKVQVLSRPMFVAILSYSA